VADGGTAVAETDIVAGGNEVLPARQVDTSDVVVDDSVSGTGDVVVAEEGVGEVVDAPAENVAPEIKQKIDDYIVQLEKDKKLQIKCPPGMTWKAKKGMQSGFTKGGKWEVLTKFNGKSHEMGGIDIELGGGKFKMSNKNGEFKAKFGLVIPCKK
jgi:hypothetical protein